MIFELSKWESEYAKAEMSALRDSTYESNFKAAILAPSVFLKKPNDFESCFDAIIYHLDTALGKSGSDETSNTIRHIAQILFHSHIDMIQRRVEYLQEENERDFFEKLFGGKREYVFNIYPSLFTSIELQFGIELANLIVSYFKILHESWKLNHHVNFFYLKIAKVFRKILASKCYDSKIKYIENVIDSNKTNIAHAFIYTQEWDEAVEFLAYLEKFQPYQFKYIKKIIVEGHTSNCSFVQKGLKRLEFNNRIAKAKKAIK